MLCRLYQWQMEFQLDDGRIPNRRLQNHLNRCSRCREYLHRLTAAAEILRSRPPVAVSDSSCKRLTANAIEYVERGVTSETLSCDNPRVILGAKRFAAAAAAVFLAAAGLLIYTMEKDKSLNQMVSTLALGTQAIQTPLPAVAEWSEKPMRSEIEKLVAGAQNAIQFLWDCTPGHFEQTRQAEPNSVSELDR